METENLEEKENRTNLETLMKSGEAFRFISSFEQSKAYEVTEGGETKKFIEFIGSSDQEDLMGDIMDLSALKEMQKAAPGTIMLRDHKRDTDKIFGWIISADLKTEGGKWLIIFKAEVDEEDKANIRIWNSIAKGRKLGASVTALVKARRDNPNRQGGFIFTSVYLLEVSIVAIPCNQDSWTLAATASKALHLMEAAAAAAGQAGRLQNFPMAVEKAADLNLTEKKELMTEETQKEAAVAVVEAAAENKTVLSLTKAAKQAHLDRRAAAETSKIAPEVLDVAVKGLFVDEQVKRQPTLWDLFDILCSVKWHLNDRKWAMEYAGGEDDFDYVGEYRTACAEFAEAAVKSFAYYGGYTIVEDEVVVIVEELTDDIVSNAFALEKAFEGFAGDVLALPVDNREKMMSIGKMFVETAKEAGIPLVPETVEKTVIQEPTEDVIRKSVIFVDTENRASTAEARVEELTKDLEFAEAGLEAALEAFKNYNSQPLQIDHR